MNTLFRSIVVTMIVFGAAFAPAYSHGQVTADEWLDGLAGSWSLTGAMGDTPLHQRVDAEWVVGGRFLQVRVVQTDAPEGSEPYEAWYLLGRDDASGQYVMYLFDTFSVGYSRTHGVGTRDGDSVEFMFDYPAGRFSNRFTWMPDTGQWTMVQRRQRPSGEWAEFATKTLTPVPVRGP